MLGLSPAAPRPQLLPPLSRLLPCETTADEQLPPFPATIVFFRVTVLPEPREIPVPEFEATVVFVSVTAAVEELTVKRPWPVLPLIVLFVSDTVWPVPAAIPAPVGAVLPLTVLRSSVS